MNGRDDETSREARFGGVDWSWERHAVCVVDPGGAVVERYDAEHSAAGLGAMVRRLRRAGVERVAIERGDGPVVDALLAGGLQVVVISSRQVKALRLRYGTAGNKGRPLRRLRPRRRAAQRRAPAGLTHPGQLSDDRAAGARASP